MAGYLRQGDVPSLEAVCYTSQIRRSHWNWRLATVVDEEQVERLRSMLAAYAVGEAVDDLVVGESRLNQPPKVTFFFSGQGGQRVGMGADLYASQPIFRRAFDECAAAAEPYLKRPLTDHCFNGVRGEMIADAVAAQAALCALQISLARLWRAWGVEPDIVLGQSMGEFAAAVTAGVFDLKTGVALAAERAYLMADQPVKGAMGVIFTDSADADSRLERYADRVWLAGQNGPRELVIAGYAPDVAELLAECDAAGICDATGLIFGLTCLLTRVPLDRYILNRTGWVQFGSALLLVLVSVGMWAANPQDPVLPRWVGIGFLVLLLVYLYAAYAWSRGRASLTPQTEDKDTEEIARLPWALLLLVGGLACVILGARVLVPAAAETAVRMGVPDDIIAATLVAFGTSLPELVTAVTAVRRGHPEITVGNIVGADVLNCLFVIGAAAAARPLAIPPTFFLYHFPALLLILVSFRLFISLNRSGTFSRLQGAWLLSIYIVYVVLQYT